MNYKYKTDQAVNEFVKFKIDFCKINNTYLFNNKWISEIDAYYYSEKIKNIKNLFLMVYTNVGTWSTNIFVLAW